jgi:hypothetical protein
MNVYDRAVAVVGHQSLTDMIVLMAYYSLGFTSFGMNRP